MRYYSSGYKIREDQQVDLHSDHIQVQYARYDGLGFHVVLPKLIEALKGVKAKGQFAPLQGGALSYSESASKGEIIKQDDFWPFVASHLLPNVSQRFVLFLCAHAVTRTSFWRKPVLPALVYSTQSFPKVPLCIHKSCKLIETIFYTSELLSRWGSIGIS